MTLAAFQARETAISSCGQRTAVAWDATATLLSDRGVLLLVKRCVHSMAGGCESLRAAAALLLWRPCLKCAADLQVCRHNIGATGCCLTRAGPSAKVEDFLGALMMPVAG